MIRNILGTCAENDDGTTRVIAHSTNLTHVARSLGNVCTCVPSLDMLCEASSTCSFTLIETTVEIHCELQYTKYLSCISNPSQKPNQTQSNHFLRKGLSSSGCCTCVPSLDTSCRRRCPMVEYTYYFRKAFHAVWAGLLFNTINVYAILQGRMQLIIGSARTRTCL